MIKILLEGLNFPESPFWSRRDSCIYFTEWMGNRLRTWREARCETVFELEQTGGPSGAAQDADGNFWLCLYDACALAKFSPQGQKLVWIDNWEGRAFKGVCDLALDSQGGVYFSDSGDFEDDWRTGLPEGALYYLNPSGELLKVDSGLCFPNGMALSPDGRLLYVNEHRANRVLRFTVGTGGQLSNRSVFFDLDDECLLPPEQFFELGPDGCCTDEAGLLYLAHYGGGKLVIVHPDGAKCGEVRLPRGCMPTNITYHPEQNAFYVTEAQEGLLYWIQL